MSCKHPRFTISEEWVSEIVSSVEFGVLSEDANQTLGEPTGRYRFHCHYCGLDKVYTDTGNSPKWVRHYLKKLKGGE